MEHRIDFHEDQKFFDVLSIGYFSYLGYLDLFDKLFNHPRWTTDALILHDHSCFEGYTGGFGLPEVVEMVMAQKGTGLDFSHIKWAVVYKNSMDHERTKFWFVMSDLQGLLFQREQFLTRGEAMQWLNLGLPKGGSHVEWFRSAGYFSN